MIQVKCTQKFKTKAGKIYGYRIVDLNGQTKDVSADELKRVITEGKVSVVNLKLTSNGRLIDCKEALLDGNISIGCVEPVKTRQSKKDKFTDEVIKLIEGYVIALGGDVKDIVVDERGSGYAYLLGTAYGLYYDFYNDMYGATFGIDAEDNEAFIYLQKGTTDDPVVSVEVDLTRPIETKENLSMIKLMVDKAVTDTKSWIKEDLEKMEV